LIFLLLHRVNGNPPHLDALKFPRKQQTRRAQKSAAGSRC
jgi:hypothetical protein